MKRALRRPIFVLSLLLMLLESPQLAARRPFDAVRAAGIGNLPPAAPVAAVYQPLNEHLDVFVVDSTGALNVVWKAQNGAWNSPYPLTGNDFAKPGASVAAVYYPTNQNLEVFVVDKNGAFNVIWKEHDGAWHSPVGLTPAGFAPPGAPLAAVYQPLNEHLEVFVVDTKGAVNVLWKANNGPWNTPFPLTATDFVKSGASLTAVYYPMNENLEVFVVDKNSVFNVIWKEHDGAWYSPVGLTAAGFAPPGAPLAAVYQPLNEHLEVFVVDARGPVNVLWKANNGPWNTPFALTDADFVKPGASLSAVYYPPNEQLEVHVVDKNGPLSLIWKAHDGKWNAPMGITERRFVPGASVAAVYYPLNDQLEAFTTDRGGVLNVEWKARNLAWVPCSFPLMGTPPTSAASGPITAPTIVRTERVGQLTGNTDPENLPILNSTTSGEWQGAGVEGVDLGTSTEHNGRLYIFFGDVAGSRTDFPDLVGWTTDTALRPGGFTLHPVKAGRLFDPFSVDSGIGSLPQDRTPAGAFSYKVADKDVAYVFALWNDPSSDPGFPTTVLASKPDPSQPGDYHLEFTFSKRLGGAGGKFWGVAPTVVHNAEHPGFPSSEGDGLVILAGGAFDEVYLAWMRLDPKTGPVLGSVRYYTGNPGQPWSPAESDAASALKHEPEAKSVVHLPHWFSSVSATWLADAKQWILLYSTAVSEGPPTPDKPNPRNFPSLPIVARFGADPWSWSDEVEIFNPCRDVAYGHFMHWPGLDDIDRRVPPNLTPPDAWASVPSSAYGAFIMQRFTSWNAASRELTLAYLMSLFNPYQVQVMRTQLRLPPAPASSALTTGTILAPSANLAAAASQLLTPVGKLLPPTATPSPLTTGTILAPSAILAGAASQMLPSSPQDTNYHNAAIVAGWPQLLTYTQGEAVRSLQYLLQQSGAVLAESGVDGKFGAETNQATLDFQKAQGLRTDGIVGPDTWQALIVPLQQGSQGPAVEALQSQLRSRGLTVNVDGDFGDQTAAAVGSYQQSRGINEKGQVGAQTWQALLAGR